MTIRNFHKAVAIAIVGGLLFVTGSMQAYLHYYDPAQVWMARDNLRAISMGAFLLIAEVVFLLGDVRLMKLPTRERGKRLIVGATMAVIAITMAVTIGSEFASSLTEKRADAGIAKIEEYREQELKTARRKERGAVRAEAREMTMEVVKGVTDASVGAYLANFIVAMLAFVVFQFCDVKGRERRKPVTVAPGGDQIPHVPGLAAQVQNKIGMVPDAAKAYAVDGGWAIWRGRDYQGFVRASDLAQSEGGAMARPSSETLAVANSEASQSHSV